MLALSQQNEIECATICRVLVKPNIFRWILFEKYLYSYLAKENALLLLLRKTIYCVAESDQHIMYNNRGRSEYLVRE